MRLLCPVESTSSKIARGEDIFLTLINEQTKLHSTHHLIHEVDSDEDSAENGKQLANIAKAKSYATKILDRQRSKIPVSVSAPGTPTIERRPTTAPSNRSENNSNRITMINMKKIT